MADSLAIKPGMHAEIQVCRASSSCCGAKLDLDGKSFTCRECGQPCERVLSAPERMTFHG